MKKMIFLSLIFLFLLCFINNEEVLAQVPENPKWLEDLALDDVRLNPQKYCGSPQCRPTVRPLPGPALDMNQDTKILYNSMKNLGTNEHAIIRVVTRRGSIQRIELAKAYKQKLYRESTGIRGIVNHLNDEIGGLYRIAMLDVITPLPIYYAHELKPYLQAYGTEQTVVEILCTISNFGIKSIAAFYKDLSGKPLEEDILKHATGTYQAVLLSLVRGKRAEGFKVDNQKAVADAKILNSPAAKPWKSKQQFTEIFGTRNYPHLRQVFIEYKKVSGREIEEDIKKEFSGPEAQGLLQIVRCVRSKTTFFANNLKELLNKKGDELDGPLIRILVGRSEIDLEDIKIEYQRLYKVSLESVVANKIGGDYRRTLTNMIRGNASPPPPPPKPPKGK